MSEDQGPVESTTILLEKRLVPCENTRLRVYYYAPVYPRRETNHNTIRTAGPKYFHGVECRMLAVAVLDRGRISGNQ